MPRVIIFGGGISGLTVAHELLECNNINNGQPKYEVFLYEKNNIAGGFARSIGLTEHSWRAYMPVYDNFFDIAKRIPIGEYWFDGTEKTVYDNLSEPISNLFNPHDNITERGIDSSKSISFMDFIKVGYPIAKVMMSDKRREKYAKISYKKKFENKLSLSGYDVFISRLAGLGIDADSVSMSVMGKFTELKALSKFRKYLKKIPSGEIIEEKYPNADSLHVMTKPTSEAWFDPWIKYLKKMGLHIHINSELVKINMKFFDESKNKCNGVISNCMVSISDESEITFPQSKNKIIYIGSEYDKYVFAIDPFSLRDILIYSQLYCITPEFENVMNVAEDGPIEQIGFQIMLNKTVPLDRAIYIFPDSEFAIVMYSSSRIFNIEPTIFSGTITQANIPGKIYGKPAIYLNEEELKQEIIYQIFRSKEFQNILNNGIEVAKINIWHGKRYNGSGKIFSKQWANTLNTYPYRPNQITQIPNAYIGGAHTKTTMDIYTMEGAVESGKIIAKNIIDKTVFDESKRTACNINLISHESPWYLKLFQQVDNVLYDVGLPNVLDVILLLFVIIIILSFLIYQRQSFLIHLK